MPLQKSVRAISAEGFGSTKLLLHGTIGRGTANSAEKY